MARGGDSHRRALVFFGGVMIIPAPHPLLLPASREKAARNGGAAAPETRDMKPAKPHIFVPPRAPDDPGPDPGDFEEDRFAARFVRPT